MKRIYFLMAIVLLTVGTNYAQEKTYLSQAINIAGKQRMLGQRMAKNKVYLEANKKAVFASQELEQTIISFQKGLKTLADFAPTPAVQHKVAIQEYVFKVYKEHILDNSKESLIEIVNTNTLFLAICDDVVTELINYSKTLPESKSKSEKYVIDKIAEATGASGKLRYLTQRLTLYFAMNKFGIKTVSSEDLEEIIKTLDKNLNYLTVLEFNTIEIDDALAEVDLSWNELKSQLYSNGKLDIYNTNINAISLYDLCNKILTKANTATKMYADLNKS